MKHLLLVIVMLGGSALGRFAFLVRNDVPSRYHGEAINIELIQVAPFGAIPAGLLGLLMARAARAKPEQEKDKAIALLDAKLKDPALTVDDRVILIQAKELL